MQASWSYRNERYKFGPLTWEQLVAATRVGRLKSTDAVRQGDGEWVDAESVDGLLSQAETPAVEPPEQPPTPSNPEDLAALEPTVEWDITSDGACEGSVPADDASDDSDSESSSGDHYVFDEPGSPSGGAGSGVGGSTTVIRRLESGSLLGNYEILGKIGQGGMGTVLKARHLRMDRHEEFARRENRRRNASSSICL
jgi:hypothetical protein